MKYILYGNWTYLYLDGQRYRVSSSGQNMPVSSEQAVVHEEPHGNRRGSRCPFLAELEALEQALTLSGKDVTVLDTQYELRHQISTIPTIVVEVDALDDPTLGSVVLDIIEVRETEDIDIELLLAGRLSAETLQDKLEALQALRASEEETKTNSAATTSEMHALCSSMENNEEINLSRAVYLLLARSLGKQAAPIS